MDDEGYNRESFSDFPGNDVEGDMGWTGNRNWETSAEINIFKSLSLLLFSLFFSSIPNGLVHKPLDRTEQGQLPYRGQSRISDSKAGAENIQEDGDDSGWQLHGMTC